MTFDCIVSQVHIPQFDVQGGLQACDKRHLVEFGIQHLRTFNPDAYIILTGHGVVRPGDEYLKLCDYVEWDDICQPLDKYGYVVGMPAQFKYVWSGLNQAKRKGFDRCLKTRGDCLIGIPSIAAHCSAILDEEDTKLLVTQQTGDGRLGDCFMFGNTELLWKTWHKDNPVFNSDGLQNTAYHYRRALLAESANWIDLIRSTCSFRDVHRLKFTCMRWNYRALQSLDDDMCEKLLDPDFDFDRYCWGRTQGWNWIDNDGNMICGHHYLWTQKEFYRAAANP